MSVAYPASLSRPLGLGCIGIVGDLRTAPFATIG